MLRRPVFAATIALVLAMPLLSRAQWLDIKSVGIPRLPDGKADMNAPWPKLADGRSDLSGLWISVSSAAYHMNVLPGQAAIMTEAGARLFRERSAKLGSGFMAVTCMPFGPVAMLSNEGGPTRIDQSAASIAFLFGNMTFREIHTDRRALPKDPSPAWMGYSTGHWEDDTLVIESNGFREETWLDPLGHPHSEQLRLVERLRRRDFGHLEYEVTFTDPVYYRQPFTVKGDMNYLPDYERVEYVCNENERDRSHLRGISLPSPAVELPANVLNRYAGVYKARKFDQTLKFEVRNGQLCMFDGPARYPFEYPMEPLSENEFLVPAVGTAVFSMGADGAMEVRFSGDTWTRER